MYALTVDRELPVTRDPRISRTSVAFTADALSSYPLMESCRLTIKAQPGARHDAVAGLLGEAIKIRLQAPAVDGKANRALLAFLARRLGLKPRDLRLIAGQSARHKIVEIQGLNENAARDALLKDKEACAQTPPDLKRQV